MRASPTYHPRVLAEQLGEVLALVNSSAVTSGCWTRRHEWRIESRTLRTVISA